jgi:phytoene dehydrogenase-like protein
MSSVAIIGAGLGGLTAGNLLVQKGHRVTIFESHRAPGGYTAGFHRKGFYFESGTLSFEGSRFVFKTMREIGVFDQVDFVRHDSRLLSSDYDIITDSYDRYKEELYAAYPDEHERLSRYFRELDRMYGVFLPFMSPEKSTIFSYLASGLKMMVLMKKYSGIDIVQFTERYFDRGTKLYNLFKSFGYPKMSAAVLGGAFATIFNDYWTVKSGMQHWADVLADSFTKGGGDLRVRTMVNRIKTRNGRAVGVQTDDSLFDADYVVAACDYKKTFLQLLDDISFIPDYLMVKIRESAVSEGFFTVYLGLSLSNDILRRYLKIPYVFFIDGKGEADVHDSSDPAYFEKAGLTIFSPSLLNPSHAPAGSSSLMIQVMVPFKWMDDWGGGDQVRYRKLKKKAADTLVDRTAALIPGLKENIEIQDAATPHTYERYTHNTNGATSAWSWNPDNKFYKSMFSTTITTPVKNLFIGSCWASQLGGIPGAIQAARRCTRKIG